MPELEINYLLFLFTVYIKWNTKVKKSKIKNEMTTSGENAASNCKNARFCATIFFIAKDGVVFKVGS
jgi:hypothetical protein